MGKHTTYFDVPPGGMRLTNAILLYRGGSAFASMHEVEQDQDGRPTIAAGTPLTRAHLRHWTEALGKAARPEILPDNVLVAHPDLLAWWVLEQVRPAYFALTRPPTGLKALAERTTVPVPYPAHLFVATRGDLAVYALPASERPTAATPLLFSPVLNIFISGKLCWGNIARPKAPIVAAMADYERAVFESWSTHPNPGQELTLSGKGGLVQLWDDLADRGAKRFPVKRLKPFRQKATSTAPGDPITFGQLVAGFGR